MFSSWFSRISVDEQVQEESRLTESLSSSAEWKDFPSLSSMTSLTCVLTRRQEFCDSDEEVGLDGRESEASPSVCLGEGASVGREEVSGRGQRRQASRHVGQEGEVGKTLDVGLEFFPHLGHSGQFLLVLLQTHTKPTDLHIPGWNTRVTPALKVSQV